MKFMKLISEVGFYCFVDITRDLFSLITCDDY